MAIDLNCQALQVASVGELSLWALIGWPPVVGVSEREREKVE